MHMQSIHMHMRTIWLHAHMLIHVIIISETHGHMQIHYTHASTHAYMYVPMYTIRMHIIYYYTIHA